MVFKSILAKAGIGSAQVDTILQNSTATPGSILSGEVVIKGGQVPQKINGIELYLESIAEREMNDMEDRVRVTLGASHLSQAREIGVEEILRLPFNFQVPLECPINLLYGQQVRSIPVTLRTCLDISAGKDSGDVDPVWIAPNEPQKYILDTFLRLGMHLKSTDLEYGRAGASRLPCYQEIEFYPGSAFSHIREVELTFVGHPEYLEVIIESDRKRRGMAAYMHGGSFDDIQLLRIPYHAFHSVDVESQIRRILNGY
jgi:sporulation-control protein